MNGYKGPYPKDAIEAARKHLICTIEDKDSAVWRKIKRKVGIKKNGQSNGSFIGWGKCSNQFSYMGFHDAVQREDESEGRASFSSAATSQGRCYPKPSGANPTDTIVIDLTSLPDSERAGTGQSVNVNLDTLKQEQISIQTESDSGNLTTAANSDEVPAGGELFFIDRQARQIEDIIMKEDTDLDFSISSKKEKSTQVLSGVNENTLRSVTVNEPKKPESKTFAKQQNDQINQANGMNDQLDSSFLTYMCDFCFHADLDKQRIKEHLEKETHFTASQYLVSLDEMQIYLKDEVSVICKEAAYKNLVARCPVCGMCFSTTFECAYHCYQHPGQGLFGYRYFLAKVKNLQQINVDSSFLQCMVCNMDFETAAEYLSHVGAENHVPGATASGKFVFYSCFYCKRSFSCYSTLCSHQSEKHEDMCTNGTYQQVIAHLEDAGSFRLPCKERPLEVNGSRTCRSACLPSERCQKKLKIDEFGNYVDSPGGYGLSLGLGRNNPDEFSAKLQELAQSNFTVNNRVGQIELEFLAASREAEEKSEMKKLYKCDFCDVQMDHELQMALHLKNEKHYSASLVSVNSVDDMYISKPMAIKVENCFLETFVPSCPFEGCQEVFGNTFEASEHYRVSHDPLEQLYRLSKIVAVNEFPVIQRYKCTVCDERYKSVQKYRGHLQQNKDHIPVKIVRDAIPVFKCCSCNVFSREFAWMAKHAFNKHKTTNTTHLRILYVSQVHGTVKKLLPFSPESYADIVTMKMKSLSKVRLLTKMSKKAYRKERSGLKRLRKQFIKNQHIL